VRLLSVVRNMNGEQESSKNNHPTQESVDECIQKHKSWHALSHDEVLSVVEATELGLSTEEATVRLSKAGRNQLPSRPTPPWWLIGLHQFQNPLIYILAFAAIVSLVIGEWVDAGFITAVLLVNALIGGIQEWRAEQNTRALQKLLKMRASVLRDGQVNEIDAQEVVPGDIVWLESGNRVPSDIHLLHTHGFEVDESLLTGESLAVIKDATWVGEDKTALADRKNMIYAGSVVVRGRGKGVTVATGMATHVGQLALDVLSAKEGQPPLLVRLQRFTRAVALIVLVAATLVGITGILFQDRSISEMLLFSVALAVSAIPEGLPVAITVALAIATTRMARRGVIVRKLGAVEGLGSCTLIASDKTGTLTCNELTVQQVVLPNGDEYQVSGEGFVPTGQITFQNQAVDPSLHTSLVALARAAVLCNEADLHRHNDQWVWRGDPTEIALLSLGAKLGWNREMALDLYPQVNEIPFESERQFAATYHRFDDSVQVFVIGAPERVLAMCEGTTDNHTIELAHVTAERMARKGYRVLALAEGVIRGEFDERVVPSIPSAIQLLGLVGMIDPLRPGVHEAVSACYRAGLKACMVTGDHPVTAHAIGSELGLIQQGESVVTGTELENASDSELDQIISKTRIFARVPPHQKLRIVEAAQRQGNFVAVTGDGVNDAPALRRANIGIAMGKSGTDVARDAADLVISDDNFATIVAGVEEGRIAYSNVRNVIYLLISTGAAEIVLMILAIATGLPLPLLPAQLLWLNLVTNGIQDVTLAFEPGTGDELCWKPRPPQERIFNRLMIERTAISALVMGGIAFGTFSWLLDHGWSVPSARNLVLLLMVLFENIQIGNCRSETVSAFRLSPFRNPILLVGTLVAQLVHIAIMYVPFGWKVLHTEPITFTTWTILFALALSVIVVMEIHKRLWTIRHPS